MKTCLSIVTGISLAAVLVAHAQRPPVQAPIKVLLITGQSNRYHNWEVSSPIVKRQLEAGGRFAVTVVTTPPKGTEPNQDMSSFAPAFSDFRAVVLDYEGFEFAPRVKQAFVDYVKTGGGLVVLHAADNAFPGWPEYNEMIGVGGWGGFTPGYSSRTQSAGPKIRWRGTGMVLDHETPGTAQHPSPHDFVMTVRAPDHPIMKGLPATWLHANDELYSNLRGPAKNVTVLATATAPTSMQNGTGEHEPIIMAIAYGSGRVFHDTLGHVGATQKEPIVSMSSVDYRVLLQRGTEWAATGTVTIPVPPDFPASGRTPGAQPPTPASPLVRLQKLGDDSTHLHTDEVRHRPSDQKLFHCSYTFGVIDTRNPDGMVYLAGNLQHTIPGDTRRPGCIHLAWEGDVVYTVHRGNIDNPTFLSGWDLRPDPGNPQKLSPVQLPVLQEPGVSYEGLDTANGHIYVALRSRGLGIYTRDPQRGFVRVGTSTDLNNAWGVRVRGTTAFVSDGLAGLAILDVADPANPKPLGRVMTGGQARGLALEGNIAYVAAGSAGLVVVDISKLAAPRVIARAETPGSAIRVDFSAGRVYVAAWNDARVYDVASPAKPRFIGAVRMTKELGGADDNRPPVTSRTLGVAARGDVMFVGNWHQIYSYRVVPNRVAPSLSLPEEVHLIDFGPVAPGSSAAVPLTLTNQGTAPLTVTGVSTDKAQFTATPSRARILPGKTATLTLKYTASTPEKETSLLHITSDDPVEPSRVGYLVGNQPGLGVGRKLPETTINLVDGGQWQSSKEAKGQVTLLAYFATF